MYFIEKMLCTFLTDNIRQVTLNNATFMQDVSTYHRHGSKPTSWWPMTASSVAHSYTVSSIILLIIFQDNKIILLSWILVIQLLKWQGCSRSAPMTVLIKEIRHQMTRIKPKVTFLTKCHALSNNHSDKRQPSHWIFTIVAAFRIM